MKKVEVEFRIFSGFISLSFFCISLIIYLIFNFEIDFGDYFLYAGSCCAVFGAIIGAIFVAPNSVGLYNTRYVILLIISFVLMCGLVTIILLNLKR